MNRIDISGKCLVFDLVEEVLTPRKSKHPMCVSLVPDNKTFTISIYTATTSIADYEFRVEKNASNFLKTGPSTIVLTNESTNNSTLLKFTDSDDCKVFAIQIEEAKKFIVDGKSLFDSKIEVTSSEQYFHYYGQLAQQQNMLQDFVRTGTYQRAMLENSIDFNGKVVMDVGCGTGMLSFFAIQAGAARVYAVEASNMAVHAENLAKTNRLENRLIVVRGKVEEVTIPEQVDIIISEPMGILLVNERMLESYIYARKWLKEGGQMYPTCSDVYCTPFQDDLLYMETTNKAAFWAQNSFYGVNLKGAFEAAQEEYFGMPVVDSFDPNLMLAKPSKHSVDFMTCTEQDLAEIKIPLDFKLQRPATVHGLCFWFDVLFHGSCTKIWLSTGPSSPLTHWYQVRCLLKEPINVGPEDRLTGMVTMVVNTKQSYNIHLEVGLNGQSFTTNEVNLKDPFYRCADYSNYNYNSQPTEDYD